MFAAAALLMDTIVLVIKVYCVANRLNWSKNNNFGSDKKVIITTKYWPQVLLKITKHLKIFFIYPSIYIKTWRGRWVERPGRDCCLQTVYLSISPSLHLSIYPTINQLIYLSFYLETWRGGWIERPWRDCCLQTQIWSCSNAGKFTCVLLRDIIMDFKGGGG